MQFLRRLTALIALQRTSGLFQKSPSAFTVMTHAMCAATKVKIGFVSNRVVPKSLVVGMLSRIWWTIIRKNTRIMIIPLCFHLLISPIGATYAIAISFIPCSRIKNTSRCRNSVMIWTWKKCLKLSGQSKIKKMWLKKAMKMNYLMMINKKNQRSQVWLTK